MAKADPEIKPRKFRWLRYSACLAQKIQEGIHPAFAETEICRELEAGRPFRCVGADGRRHVNRLPLPHFHFGIIPQYGWTDAQLNADDTVMWTEEIDKPPATLDPLLAGAWRDHRESERMMARLPHLRKELKISQFELLAEADVPAFRVWFAATYPPAPKRDVSGPRPSEMLGDWIARVSHPSPGAEVEPEPETAAEMIPVIEAAPVSDEADDLPVIEASAPKSSDQAKRWIKSTYDTNVDIFRDRSTEFVAQTLAKAAGRWSWRYVDKILREHEIHPPKTHR